jgi:hypothetical protein
MATESNETQPVSTEVTIGGQRFELKNMTAEQGTALYELLSPEDKKLADSIAAIAKNFHSLSSIELPPGVSVTTALERYFGALKAGRGKIEDGAAAAAPFLKQMDGFIGELPAVQSIRKIAGAANTTADVWDGAVRGFMAPYRALMATPGLASTLTPGTNISDEQARAFGAAYAAAEAMHRAPAKEEGIGGFFASTSRTLGYGYMRLMHSLPFIPTVMSAIGHWFQGLPANWDFGAAWDKAKEEVASEQKAELNKYGGHMPTLEQYQTHARQVGMQEKARPAAAAMVTAAGSIAGIEAPKLVEAITKGGIIRTHEGGLAQVTIQDGRPVQEAAKGPDGKPLTVGTERKGMVAEALPEPGRSIAYDLGYGAAVGVGTVAGAAGLHGVAEGVARQTAGGQAFEAGKFGRAAVEDLADKPKGFYNNFVTKPFRWAGRAVGDMAGIVADKTLDAVSSVPKLGGWMAGAIKGPIGRRVGALGLLVTPAVAVAEIKAGEQEGNKAKVANATGDLITFAGDAAIGVGVAALAAGTIASAPVILGGAAAGTLVGWIVSTVRGKGAFERVSEDKETATNPTPILGSTGTPDLGLAAAATHAEQNAQKARDQARYAMAGTKSTMLGAVHSVADGSTVQSSKVAFVPVAAAPISFDFA